MAEFLILPAVYMGGLLGLYEIFLVHKDEAFRGSHWLKHGWHALLVTMFFVFIAMNVDFLYGIIPALASVPVVAVRVIIGILAAAKVHTAAAVLRSSALGPTLGETWIHSLVIGTLITVSPYIWPFLEPLFTNILGLPV